MPETSPVRFAVVGSSGFAARNVAPALVASEAATLVGVLGSTQAGGAALTEAVGAGRAYGSLEELLGDDQVDAVWIAASDALHEPVGVACMRAGKHVIVEKPMATSVEGARSLVEVASETGVVLRVGTHQRYRRVYQDIRREILSLGRLGFARLHFFVPAWGERMVGNWRATLAGSGGSWVTKEFGAHLVDLLLWWTGPARLAGALLRTIAHDVETEDAAAMLLSLGGGGIGIIDVSSGMHGWTHEIELYGTEGWLRARDVWHGGGYIERSTASGPAWSSEGERRDYPGDGPLDPYVEQLRDFASALAGGPSIGADGQAGLAALELILEAVESGGGPTAGGA